MLARMKEQGIEPDYLQVYRLSYSEQEKVLSIRHSQEEPDYENTVSFELPFGVKPYTGKLYYIDDGDHRTFLLAEEYWRRYRENDWEDTDVNYGKAVTEEP